MIQFTNESEYKEGIKLYNVQNNSPEILKSNFVIRLNEYKQIWKAISNSNMLNPEQHYIVQGLSGSGKTTLLKRLALQVKHDPSTSQWLIPIVFKEQEYGITSLFSFWERVCEALNESHQSHFNELFDNIQTLIAREPKQAIDMLSASLSKANKKIILFIDNFVELVDSFNANERGILQELLITNNNIRFITGSRGDLASFYDYKVDFYQFFNVVTLKGLNKQDTLTLLKKLSEYRGEAEQQRLKKLLTNAAQKIETIRRLTDATPRIVVILFDILMRGSEGGAFELLEASIDQITPLYTQRMHDLSKQQKNIINAIAIHWDAISAKEIANKTHLPSKQVSAQLSQLEKQGLIQKISTNTKNHLYILKERFFNIWFLIRYGRQQDRKRVIWLTHFIESWCSDIELKIAAVKLRTNIKKGTSPQASLMVANALTCTNFLNVKTKNALFSKMSKSLLPVANRQPAREILSVDDKTHDSNTTTKRLFAKFFQVKVNQQLIEKSTATINDNDDDDDDDDDDAKIAIAQLYDKNENTVIKAELILKATQSEYNHFMLATFYCTNDRYKEALPLLIPYQQDNAAVNALLASSYHQLGEYQQAEVFALTAITLGDESCHALLATIYYHLKQYIQCEKHARKAIHLGDNNAYLELAFSLFFQQQYQASIDTFKQLLDIAPNINTSSIHCMQGIVYKEAEDYQLAEVSFLKSLNLVAENKIAYVELADLYMKQAKFSKTETCFDKLLELGGFGYWDELIQLHIFKKDIVSIEEIIEESLNNNYLDIYNTVAWRYFENQFQANKALNYSKIALNLTPNLETYHTNVAVSLWNNNLELATKSMNYFLNNYILEVQHNESAFVQLFTLFLAKGQKTLVDKWLKEHQLTERFKPLYYALMSLMLDKYPNEILRMGGELKETVNETLLTVEKLAKKYK